MNPFFQHTQLLASRRPGVAPRWRLAALVGWALPLVVHAETATPVALPALPDASTSLLRVLGAMAVVFAVFFAIVWLYRNWQKVLRRTGRMPLLNVVEARTLGNRHSIYVVTCGDQRFLIGSSPAGLNLLSQLPTPESAGGSVAETELRPTERTTPIASFADTLHALMERK